MEWTWRQQLIMLLQSSGVGFLLGILYDFVTTIGRVKRFSRPIVFTMDALLGLLAAVVTFYFALVITGGYMHPFLFVGVSLGALTEHGSVSHVLCRAFTALLLTVTNTFAWINGAATRLHECVNRLCCRIFTGIRNNLVKIQKKL